ncbi:bifunctional 2-polyprenyl-6-hydroxyphenol methylase/3-demethylubiquinol 3-O-methyltransferase UbiG [Labrenzia sp. VG12]|uniref:class I SAM-dependent methyltransferase n=1 Tax=Labrenzia sp. VG12 TaxID=2021862 RepID=UPI000B8BF55C|nr:class I SAM-dependent methyltransferase [Labrenzia sp. VG12]ASP35653.1 SAM-dependent methyltransferase [Labrenzia sp. VG12]
MADSKTIRIYDEKAGDYAARFASSRPSGSLQAFMALLPERARVLDWGCGPATASAHMQDAGFDPDPVDASPEMVALALKQFGLNARCATFSDPLPSAHYDGAWVNFSLLHASRAALPGHLRQLHEALLPGAVLHLGMKRGSGEQRDRFGRFYVFYETSELTEHLETAGFQVTHTHEGEEAGLAGTIDPFVLLLSQKA